MERRVLLQAGLMALAGTGGLFASRWLFDDEGFQSADVSRWFAEISRHPAFQDLSEGLPNAFVELSSGVLQETSGDVGAAVKQAVADDFQEGRLIVHQQWRLSRTEALLLAAAIQELGVATVEQVDKTVENAPFEDFLDVQDWGPKETYQGVKFNEQPNGHCGLWFVTAEPPSPFKLFIGGAPTNVYSSDKGFTSGIYQNVDEFISRIGQSEIVAYDEINHRKQVIGSFEVLPAFPLYRYPDGRESEVFGELGRWGPQHSALGEVFNPQPSGNAAFWIKIASKSSSVNLLFNGHEVKTFVRKDIITVSLSPELLPKSTGSYPVSLKNEETGETLHVGDFIVR